MIIDLALACAVAAATSLVTCRLLMAAGLWDDPDAERKAHRAPTPTSGGIGIAIGHAVGLLALSAWFSSDWRHGLGPDDVQRLAVATGFAYLFLVIGFFDDTYPLGPRSKFAVFVIASLCAAELVGPVQVIPLTADLVVELGWLLGLLGSALWLFTLINGVNFMDGANGLAMGSMAVGFASLAALALKGGAPDAAALALCGAGALLGFLVWNFPHGKLFAGDSGALFTGALAGLASLVAIGEGAVSPLLPPILFFPLLADVLLTLAWRVAKRRKILDGHSEHLYQVAMRTKLGHRSVALIYWAATALCGALAYGAARVGGDAPLLLLGACALTALALTGWGRWLAAQKARSTTKSARSESASL